MELHRYGAVLLRLQLLVAEFIALPSGLRRLRFAQNLNLDSELEVVV